MAVQPQGAKYNPNAEVHVILSGVLGREKVAQALFHDPDLTTEKVEVPGYGLRIQQIADIGPAEVREEMATAWKDELYMGAVGVVASSGETAQATRITTTIAKWKEANRVIHMFNFHEYGENAAKSWFHNEGVTIPGHEGEPKDIIEAFADISGLQRIEEKYKNPDEFEKEIDMLEPLMVKKIEGFRKNIIEGNAATGEQKE
ncbi:MAG TPA: hypothetical protein VLF68_03030 [Candidatus Saccharimonadales bacterium]|nr:hypothetical protein [Candidatus Saccharimonadales bacterium]